MQHTSTGEVTARIVAPRALDPTVSLEIDYEGTCPPTELFADLAMIGWEPPTPASPPASAIDWGANGTSDAGIRPWRVRGAVARPPAGTGPRGRWTSAEHNAYLLALRGVLARHGIADGNGHSDDPAGPAPALRPETTPGPGPSVAEGAPAVTGPSGPGRQHTVTLVVESDLQSRTWLALSEQSEDEPTIGSGELRVINTYRGSPYVVVRPAVTVTATVSAHKLETALQAISRATGMDPKDPERVQVA